MPTTFLNISLALESDEPLDVLCRDLHERLEYLLSKEQCKVISCTWDRSQALAYIAKANYIPVPILKQRWPGHSETVSQVCEKYNITLPKQKKGQPAWRTPASECWGEVNGLPGLRGKLILTNGIKAYLVREDGHWCDIHYNWFIPDDVEDLPEGLSAPDSSRKSRKTEMVFKTFDLSL